MEYKDYLLKGKELFSYFWRNSSSRRHCDSTFLYTYMLELCVMQWKVMAHFTWSLWQYAVTSIEIKVKSFWDLKGVFGIESSEFRLVQFTWNLVFLCRLHNFWLLSNIRLSPVHSFLLLLYNTVLEQS